MDSPWQGRGGWLAQMAATAAVAMAAAVALAGCGHLSPRDFAGTGPRFEPERYFAGHTRSRGVFEDRTGANPTRTFATDCQGTREPDGTLTLRQTFTYADGSIQRRAWRIRRVDAHRYEATANDVVGTGRGEAWGNAFHWEYTVALKPGNPLFNVRLRQWMYLQPDGHTVLNRATVSKLGVTIAQVAESFEKVPDRR